MIKQGEVLQQTFLGQTFDALVANAVSKPSLQKMGPQWVLWEFLDMGIDLFSIISMSSLKNDDNDDDFDNDGEKDEQEGDNCEDDYEESSRDLFNIISMSSLTSGSQFSLMARLKKEP